MFLRELIVEDAMMGKIADSGKIIRILKKAHTVPFSDEKNWLLVDTDPGKGNNGLGIKWIPADTRFEWVKPYRDTVDENFADGRNPQDKGDAKRRWNCESIEEMQQLIQLGEAHIAQLKNDRLRTNESK